MCSSKYYNKMIKQFHLWGANKKNHCVILKTDSFSILTETKVNQLDLSGASLLLLIEWGKIVEQIATSAIYSSNTEISLETAVDLLNDDQLKILSSNLDTLVPSCLLLSLAE